MSDTTKAVLLSVVAEATVAAVVFWQYGTGPAGAVVAARATARTSALIFAFALAMRSRPNGASLMNGFVAAHALHYTAVAYLASVAVEHHLHHLTLRSVVVVSGGLGLLVVLLLTNGGARRGTRTLNAIAVYVAYAIFLGGGLLNGVGAGGTRRPFALITVVPLLAALGYHRYSTATTRRQAAAAS